MEMLRCLRDANIDTNNVGWYQSSLMEGYTNITTINTQYSLQSELGFHCVCLLFDPLRTQRGRIALKAIRLSDKFMKLMKEHLGGKRNSESEIASSLQEAVITQEVLTKLNITSTDIFDEIPVVIHDLALVDSFLFDIEVSCCCLFCQSQNNLQFQEQIDVESTQLDCFDISTNPHLERVVEGMLECVDDLANEAHKYHYYQKKVAQQKMLIQNKKDKNEEEDEAALKAIQQPNRLESLLISHQLNNYCQQVNEFAGASLEKLYVAEFALKQQTK